MIRILKFPFLVTAVFVGLASTVQEPVPGPERFADSIERFETWDGKNTFPKDAILFVGSSSIRLWATAEAFPGKPVINRGFGGSELSDVIYYFDRVIRPYSPSLIILYGGDNDIANGKSAEQVFADYRELVGLIRSHLPDAELVFISIKPSTSRWEYWPVMVEANRLVREFAEEHRNLGFADLATPLLRKDGQPKNVYRADGLHLNKKGYELWREALAPFLE